MMHIQNDLLQGNNNPAEGQLEFTSNTHQRYEFGVPVRGEQVGCPRTIVIQKNISGNMGYTVSVNPTMSPKPMKIVRSNSDETYLQGYGFDQFALMIGVPEKDASFSCYAMTLKFDKGVLKKCTLHLLDRGVEIEYYNL